MKPNKFWAKMWIAARKFHVHLVMEFYAWVKHHPLAGRAIMAFVGALLAALIAAFAAWLLK